MAESIDREAIVEFQFTPLLAFEWVTDNGVFMGQYHPGMRYNCSRQPVHDALRAEAAKWLADGHIRVSAVPSGSVIASTVLSQPGV